MMRGLIVIFIALFVVVNCQEEGGPPPFLKGAPPAALKEFEELLKKDEDKTDKDIDADIEAFVTKLGPKFKEQFDNFKKELVKGQADFQKARQEALAKFSPAAKKADEELTKIAEDPALNGIQKRKKIKQIMEGLPEAVRKELTGGK